MLWKIRINNDKLKILFQMVLLRKRRKRRQTGLRGTRTLGVNQLTVACSFMVNMYVYVTARSACIFTKIDKLLTKR